MSDENIHSTKYQGHQGAVLCLDISHDDNLLISGSEDRTARLWDVRSNKRRASLCIPTNGEVLSVAFAPKMQGDMPFSSPNAFAHDHTIFLSVDNSVYEYDLRQATSPIFQQPTRNLSPILQNQDEINQIALALHSPKTPSASKGKQKKKKQPKPQQQFPSVLYLAAADDAGTARFMDAASTTTSHILHHDPNGVAVVPTCAFRPRCTKGLELASGGTDCKIHLWDVKKPKKPLSSYTISTPDTGDADASKPQVCNPPMCHALSWSPSGRLLAAGLGDGNIHVCSFENRNFVQTGFLSEGHDSSVASIVFMDYQERILFSGGSDGNILCWDLGAHVAGESSDGESGVHLFPESLLPAPASSSSFHQQHAMEIDEVEELAQRTQDLLSFEKPKILFGIPHGPKVNWMVTSRPSALFVADTSNDIICYNIPLR